MFRNFALLTSLQGAMQESQEVIIQAKDNNCYCGQITDISWGWCRILCQDKDRFSSWLIRLDDITSVCDCNRLASELSIEQPNEPSLDNIEAIEIDGTEYITKEQLVWLLASQIRINKNDAPGAEENN